MGLNEVEQEKPMPWWLHLWRCYSNPFNLLLTLLAVPCRTSKTTLSGMVVIAAMVRALDRAALCPGKSQQSRCRSSQGNGLDQGHGAAPRPITKRST